MAEREDSIKPHTFSMQHNLHADVRNVAGCPGEATDGTGKGRHADAINERESLARVTPSFEVVIHAKPHDGVGGLAELGRADTVIQRENTLSSDKVRRGFEKPGSRQWKIRRRPTAGGSGTRGSGGGEASAPRRGDRVDDHANLQEVQGMGEHGCHHGPCTALRMNTRASTTDLNAKVKMTLHWWIELSCPF